MAKLRQEHNAKTTLPKMLFGNFDSMRDAVIHTLVISVGTIILTAIVFYPYFNSQLVKVMAEHITLQQQIDSGTSDISSLKADIAEIKVTVTDIKDFLIPHK